MDETTVLFRPVGQEELDLIRGSDFTAFPPRLPEQPIFYPVLDEGYARLIARTWNARHNEIKVGYVTRFYVRKDYLSRYEIQTVGSSTHQEYWIPAGLCTKSRKCDSFSLRRSAYLRGLCVEMAVKRRDAKIKTEDRREDSSQKLPFCAKPTRGRLARVQRKHSWTNRSDRRVSERRMTVVRRAHEI